MSSDTGIFRRSCRNISASIDLLQQSSESLAGRVAYLELLGVNRLEYAKDINTLWLRGRFPESPLAGSEEGNLDGGAILSKHTLNVTSLNLVPEFRQKR